MSRQTPGAPYRLFVTSIVVCAGSHTTEFEHCAFLLKEAEIVMQQTRGGCTRGECLEGFLSPRMLAALHTQAELGHDMLNFLIDEMTGPEWVRDNSHFLIYKPAGVRNNLKTNKSMRQGYINLWKHIATCLHQKAVPTELNVLKTIRDAGEWPPVAKNFLGRGGSVESVFLMICKCAMDQDEWIGDGEYQDVFAEDIVKLPECRNDLEFGCVSGSCGYRRISMARHPWEPL